ncbi:hypothetical protein [Vibrio campbellii]|uniref:hypothetical protein n=1 Tax=Vibrio campbellii TaxID=680 RepID=UPI004056EC53
MSEDWVVKKDGSSATPKYISYGFDNYDTKCVKYTQATSKDAPATVAVTDTEADCK